VYWPFLPVASQLVCRERKRGASRLRRRRSGRSRRPSTPRPCSPPGLGCFVGVINCGLQYAPCGGQRLAGRSGHISRPESSAYRRLPQSPAQRIRRHSERAPDRSRDRYARKSFRQHGGGAALKPAWPQARPSLDAIRSATTNSLLKAEIHVMHFPFAGLRPSVIWSHESGALRTFDAKSETAEKFCLNRP
jgi:hypothetical protein